jgi:curved DNA-binding protein CbpA
MTAELDPYKVLGVDHAAEPEIVAAAYRAMARRHHPDVSPLQDAERRMADINAAWALLRDPAQRVAYDREHGIADGLWSRASANPVSPLHATADSEPTHQHGASGSSASSRASQGGPAGWRRGPHGEGAAGPPPGRPQGTVLAFGRHIGWSLGEIARVDPGYLQWLAARPEGRPVRAEIDAILAPLLRTADARGALRSAPERQPKAGRFRRR